MRHVPGFEQGWRGYEGKDTGSPIKDVVEDDRRKGRGCQKGELGLTERGKGAAITTRSFATLRMTDPPHPSTLPRCGEGIGQVQEVSVVCVASMLR